MKRLAIGSSLTANVECVDEGKVVQIDGIPEWSSTNPSVAMVAPSADGRSARINAVGLGVAQITVRGKASQGVLISKAVDVQVELPPSKGIDPSSSTEIKYLSEFIGQNQLKQSLTNQIRESKISRQLLPHMLFVGPPDTGKMTFVKCLSDELGVPMQHLVAAAIKKPQELLPFLTGATDGSILVIEELDGFSRASSEFLIPALEGNRVHIDLGEGSNTRSIPMSLKRFVAVATTSKFSRVDKKLLRWFAVKDFVPYSDDEVSHWIRMLTTSAGLQIPADGLELMVSACQESLSEASTLVKKISEYFRQTKDGISLSRDAILQALSWLGYDHTQTNSLRLLAKLGSMSWGRFRRIRSAVISP